MYLPWSEGEARRLATEDEARWTSPADDVSFDAPSAMRVDKRGRRAPTHAHRVVVARSISTPIWWCRIGTEVGDLFFLKHRARKGAVRAGKYAKKSYRLERDAMLPPKTPVGDGSTAVWLAGKIDKATAKMNASTERSIQRHGQHNDIPPGPDHASEPGDGAE